MDQTRACSKSSFGLLKPTCDTCVIHFAYRDVSSREYTRGARCSWSIGGVQLVFTSLWRICLLMLLVYQGGKEKVSGEDKYRR